MGLGFGFTMSILIGPAFFLLLQLSIDQGLRAAFNFATGIIASDIVIFSLAALGISALGEGPLLTEIFELGGGILLVVFAFSLLRKKPPPPPDAATMKQNVKKLSSHNLWLRGFMLNTLNPAAFLYWIAVNTAATSLVGNSFPRFLVLLLSVMLVIFGTDLGKAYAAKALKKYLTPTFLLWFNRASGIILLFFGLFHFYKGYMLYLENHA